ncbi:hypothetical protein D3C87_628480 [compost metagenome]
MKTKLMKTVVWDARAVIKSGDYELECPHNQQLMSSICKALNEEYKRNPKTVAGIILHIEDAGYQLRQSPCEYTVRALANKEKALGDVDPKDVKKIRQICESLFAQYIKLN